MIINNVDYPLIGMIRVKERRPDGKVMLTIYPPDGSLLPVIVHEKREDVHMVELAVTPAELSRIRRVAPHLLARPAPAKEPTGMGKEPRR
jgi:hypothetical protein